MTVVRDVAGIAHIRAETVHDLFMAQGFVHAQERMWQMEVWRHISAGRLAEMFGESQLDTDRFIRTLGWRQATERDLAAMAPDGARPSWTRTREGVNAWLDQERDSLGLAFLLTGTEPEPWTALDSVGWQKVQAWNLGSNMDKELFRFLADARLGDPARTDELFPPYRDGAPVIVPGPATRRRRRRPVDAAPSATRRETPEAQATGWRSIANLGDSIGRIAGLDLGDGMVGMHGVGSNNWVVAPGLHDDRRRAPRERPAPRDLDALDLVPERAPLRAGHRRLPVRRRGRLVPGRPRGRARPQRAHRVGRHECRPGRPGPVPRAGRPG